MKNILAGALPEGSLKKPCLGLWGAAGFKIQLDDRSCFPSIDDTEIDLILVRPQEIPRFVAEGKLDFGICGYDCMVECQCTDVVVDMAELIFSKVSRRPTRWVLAVPEDSSIRDVEDMDGRLISTEFVQMTKKWLCEKGIDATVEFSWGATEVKAGRFCDAIVEATETGRSLKRNGLRIIAEVLQSTPRFIANPSAFADPWKHEKMADIILMLKGSLDAEGKVWLTMNVPRDCMDAVLETLPSLEAPTVNRLSKDGWHSVATVVDEMVVRTIIPALKKAGAMNIIETPISKFIQ